MLVDIPDAGIILVSVLAFLGGLVTLYLYTKIRSSGGAEKIAPTNLERIGFYEIRIGKRPFKNLTNYQSFTKEKDENKIEEKIQKDDGENKPQATEE